MRPARLAWQTAAIERVVIETPRVRTFALRLREPMPFAAGQHVDVRLTAPDGYRASRSYSIASSPDDDGLIELSIELMPDGEVSTYFHGVSAVGDGVEIRGPVGGPFTWTPATAGPLLLIAGGSGIVPIMSMLRHRHAASANVAVPAVLLNSARSWDEIIYRTELHDMAAADPRLAVIHTLTRRQPPGWNGYSRRIDAAMIEDAISRIDEVGRAYICGSDGFVETAANQLVDRGVDPADVRTERFGPTG